MRKATSHLGRLVIAAGTAAMLGLAPTAYANETVALKNALYGAGYNITNVSSQMDDATRAQLTKFQKDHGLQASGILDEETKKALGMISVQVAAAAKPKSDAAPAKAEPAAQAEPQKADDDGAIEEDEDGGWSLW
ncbi:MAG: peptidoglycan-binding protein [Gammaproteobacteria bacterium]|uniref:Peptidoglycan-binding domain 1 protein n=1 Tax=Marinobacter nitratireducens TaxID=1137280 RepID=A0A072N2P6_9GAMM|nr:peptidoglycan-binding domain-containing protein [Marinobacter nitratireducens]KEF31203.1 Peptidoglycan-binding domain 1 protein [Marinobacter nitratireducens]TNE77458.1 MAG: peptidoglycan-binding protein [Gammaproteobacteria bacterium]TNE96028.1 MAG: peptidoglycan-binding protein [Gammaproteobacteria bacterium]